MKGIELARRYYETCIGQLLNAVPEAKGRIACGLVGEGSQCFGFDDEISRDHDFAPGFCIWLNDEDFDRFGEPLQKAYDALPSSYCGFDRSNVIDNSRVGVMRISSFYGRLTGMLPDSSPSLLDWLFTPESQLAAATNGQVFRDDTGEFTAFRQRLLAFYPEDVRRKKIAARAAVMSQAGQYNLLHLIRRQDSVAAIQALGRFTEAVISMIYLLNKRYMPFYKWSFHGLRFDVNGQLELADQLCPLLEELGSVTALMQKRDYGEAHALAFRLTESICTIIAGELTRQRLSQCNSPFLQDHLEEIMTGIRDPDLRRLPPMIDCQN